MEICGIDISRTMINYANARASSQQITNASFGVMDLLQPLDFTDATFDLINARFLYVALKRTGWPPLITECKRILHPGGILRLTEADDFGITSSAAVEQFNMLNIQALYHAGYGFSTNGRTLAMSLGLLRLLKEAGFTDLQLKVSIADYSAETEHWSDFYHNGRIAILQTKPFLISSKQLTIEQFEQLYQQMHIEMWDKDFTALWQITSIWGRTPTSI